MFPFKKASNVTHVYSGCGFPTAAHGILTSLSPSLAEMATERALFERGLQIRR